MPVYVPEHRQYEGEDDQCVFWCTIHQQGSDITEYTVIVTEPETGEVIGSVLGLKDVDWDAISGYTSSESPLYLYREGTDFFAVIGEKAYCIRPHTGQEIDKTDSFMILEGSRTEDIKRLKND